MGKKQENCLTKKDISRFVLGLIVLGLFIGLAWWGFSSPLSLSLIHSDTLKMTSEELTPQLKEAVADNIDIGIEIHLASAIFGSLASIITGFILLLAVIENSNW